MGGNDYSGKVNIFLSLVSDKFNAGFRKSFNEFVNSAGDAAKRARSAITNSDIFTDSLPYMFRDVANFAKNFVVDTMQESASMKTYGQMLGWTTEQMSAWAGAAQSMGIDGERLADVFSDVSDKASDLIRNGSGPYQELFETDELKDAEGNLLSTEQIIYKISDRLKSFGEQEGTGIAKRMGFNDPGMIAFMMQGSKAIKERVEAERELGTYTDEDAKASKELLKQVNEVGRAFKMALMPVFRATIPLMKVSASAIAFLTRHTRALIPAVTALGVAFSVIAAKKIHEAATAMGGFKKTMTTGWKTPAVITALVVLGLLLDDLIGWVNGEESLFGGIWGKIFGKPENAQWINDFFGKFGTWAVGIGTVLAVLLQFPGAINLIIGVFKVLGVAIKLALSPVGLMITAIIAAAWLLYDNWDAISAGLTNLWSDFTSFMGEAWDGVVGGIKAGLNWIVEKCEFVANLWSGLKSGASKFIDEAKSRWDNAHLPSLDEVRNLSVSGKGTGDVNKSATQNNVYNIYGDVGRDSIYAAEGHAQDWPMNFVNSANASGS